MGNGRQFCRSPYFTKIEKELGEMEKAKGRRLTQSKRYNLTGWVFLTPAALLIAVMSFYPMIRCLIFSFQKGATFANMQWYGLNNYIRMFQDSVFMQSLKNTFIYFLIQVPIMLILALILASMLNNKDLKFKGFFRTAIFLPCATTLVSYAIIFRSLFSTDGFVNTILMNLGIISTPYAFLTHTNSARAIIILALVWRWTGYNMVFYLSGLQNIEYSVYEAAKIDGASPVQSFFHITVPLLKPTILLTAIMSTNGTLQLFDESVNLTNGGPANTSITMSHYIYDVTFKYVPNFGYSCAMSMLILVLVGTLAFIQMKVGDKRD
jgi:lactose/L-arabinose transport system permease protein